jgi:hypothetical protein
VPADPDPTSDEVTVSSRRLSGPLVTVVALALVGTVLGVGLTLLDLSRTTATNGWLVHASPNGPAHRIIAADLPREPLTATGEHDGTQFYAVARFPFDFNAASEHLDRPRYRLQRIVFPYAARGLVPTSQGATLVWAMFAVTVLGAFLGGVASGALSLTLRGPPWPALVFPILPGVLISSRIVVSDSLAVALTLSAMVLFLRGRTRWAVAAGALAVLTKEPMVLTLAGVALWSRDRRGVQFVAGSIAPAVAWYVFLWWRLPAADNHSSEFTWPFVGWWDSLQQVWLPGPDTLAAIVFVTTLAATVVALRRRGPRHPLWWPMVGNLALLTVLDIVVIGFDRNGPRATLPLLALAIVALAAPRAPATLPASYAPVRRATTGAKVSRASAPTVT